MTFLYDTYVKYVTRNLKAKLHYDVFKRIPILRTHFFHRSQNRIWTGEHFDMPKYALRRICDEKERK